MAREEWDHDKKEEKPEKTREGGKTVRFVNSETCDKCDSSPTEQIPQSPVAMVQSLVPHLPGLDRDTIYVISGPFPNYDPVNGPSQLLMATPISPGVTVVAVPLGPPPCAPHRQAPADQAPAGKTVPHTVPPQHGHNSTTHTDKIRRDPKSPQPMTTSYQPQTPVQVSHPHGTAPPAPHHGTAPLAPHLPHMLHWDTHHPGGQTIPLRQPNPPVYYNVPSHTNSGLQSPGSDGSSMSESSSMSEDQEDINQAQAGQGKNLCYFAPNMPHMVGHQGHQNRGDTRDTRATHHTQDIFRAMHNIAT
eukprot:GFUD01035882.1.p1 GENE.GFUD01035882.1~~GFUD01035882.1.p1  ORF type:complete len:303 (+),score=85.90 GFUD01035882.1:234-1142(+)